MGGAKDSTVLLSSTEVVVIEPYWTDGKRTIYHGDCREILPTLGKFDLLLTDPPYGNNYSTGHRKGVFRPHTRITGDVISEPLLNDVAELTEPLLNDVAEIYWFAAPDRLDMVLPIVKRWEVINVLCWDKGNCTAGDLAASYGKQWEACVYAVTAKHDLQGGRDRDILRFSRGDSSAWIHPTQKPVSMFRYLMSKHNAKTILDPFMGSGTTLVAAKLEGLEAVGIELSEKYCEAAVKRLQQNTLDFIGQ